MKSTQQGVLALLKEIIVHVKWCGTITWQSTVVGTHWQTTWHPSCSVTPTLCCTLRSTAHGMLHCVDWRGSLLWIAFLHVQHQVCMLLSSACPSCAQWPRCLFLSLARSLLPLTTWSVKNLSNNATEDYPKYSTALANATASTVTSVMMNNLMVFVQETPL